MTEPDDTFATRLDFALRGSGNSGRGLAKAIKVNKSTVSKWRTGTNLPRQPQLAAVAKFLNVPVGSLLGETTHASHAAFEPKTSLPEVEPAARAPAQDLSEAEAILARFASADVAAATAAVAELAPKLLDLLSAAQSYIESRRGS